MYQHPRYRRLNNRIGPGQQPCSVWLANDLGNSATTYIISSGKNEEWVTRAKKRLTECLTRPYDKAFAVMAEVRDPFYVQSLLCHESLVDAKPSIAQLRQRLYEVLKVVNDYSQEAFDRVSLKDMTRKLHQVSQDADSLLSSAEMGSMIAAHSQRSREEILGLAMTAVSSTKSSHPFAGSSVGEALAYLDQSLASQRRWLASYKARKDIAMNLVFNLVTQQDSETSTDIARDTKDDSASMRVIAVLTMVFLPATAVSGFFGMAFFAISDGGIFISSHLVWLYIAITVPLTFLTFSLWVFWSRIVVRLHKAILSIAHAVTDNSHLS